MGHPFIFSNASIILLIGFMHAHIQVDSGMADDYLDISCSDLPNQFRFLFRYIPYTNALT